MVKTILSVILFASIAIATPTYGNTVSTPEIIDNNLSQVSVTVSGSTVRVSGAAGLMLSVYNVTGLRVMTVEVDSPDKQLNLGLPKGCYILKVGSVVRKISIR